VAVNPEEVQFIVNAITTLTGQQQSAAQQRSLETGQATIIQAINGVLTLLRQVGSSVEEIRARLAAAQLQVAINTVQSDRNYRAIQSVPTDTTSAVWDQLVYPNYPIRMQDVMRFLEQFEDIWDNSGALDLWEAPYFLLSIGVTPGTAPPAMPIRTPIWDMSQVEAADTLLSFVSRLNSYVTWTYHTGTGDHVTGQYNDGAGSIWTFTTKLDEAAFQLLKRAYLRSSGAPIWPGLAGVTLGTPQAITPPTQTLAGPMAGVIVDITGGTANLPHFLVGAMDSWKAVGTLMFESDHGDAETFQLLGPRQAIYTPRTMTQAQSCLLYTSPSPRD